MTRETTAGTARDGYLCPRTPHRFDPTVPDPGERPRCRVEGCGREAHQHAIPTPRAADRTEQRA